METYLQIDAYFDRVKEVQIDENKLLEGLREFIGCETIDIVGIKINGKPYLMVVDDEGFCHNARPKINKIATAIYGDLIAGHALIGKQGNRKGEPDIVGLSQNDVQELRKLIG